MNPKISKSLVNKYNRDGFIHIKNFLKQAETIQLKNELFSEIERGKNKFKKRYINFTKNGSINSLHGLDKFDCIRRLQKDKRIIEAVEKIIGKSYDKFGSELFAKPAGTGLSVPIHQDNKYWCLSNSNAITMWFALDKSNKRNGGIFYFKGSHKLGLFEHEPSNAPGSSQKVKYINGLKIFQKTLPSLELGDCLIHNCLVVHGSNRNFTKNSRSGLTLRFKHSLSKIREDLRKSYENELKLQMKNR